MNLPLVSIVIESITREDYAERSLADDLQPTLDAIARQTYPREMTTPDCRSASFRSR